MNERRFSQPPSLDSRRKSDFLRELRERARIWIPDWEMDESDPDFAMAILEIAARFNSEVAERLDRVGEKMQRGFLDWLAIEGKAARAARMPVVFKLNNAAKKPVLAKAPIKMQADADGTPVIFETESDIRIVPGQLDVVIGVEGSEDCYFLPPPGLNNLEPEEPLPSRWRLKSFAAADTTQLQLDPDSGLSPGTFIEARGAQYEVVKSENGIVTISPGLESSLKGNSDANSDLVRKVSDFRPFNRARNQQEHAVYLGHNDLLNISAGAAIEIISSDTIPSNITWQFWGKLNDDAAPEWLKLEPKSQTAESIEFEALSQGSFVPREINKVESRWIRAYSKRVESNKPLLTSDSLMLRINHKVGKVDCSKPEDYSPDIRSKAVALSNTTPLVLDKMFFPLGREPKQFDAFYLGYEEAFSKHGAKARVCFKVAETKFNGLSVLREGREANQILAGVAEDGFLYVFRFDPSDGTLAPIESREPESPQASGKIESTFRPPIWLTEDTANIAIAVGNAVHIWQEDLTDPTKGEWISQGTVGVDGTSEPIKELIHLRGSSVDFLVALLDSALYIWKVVKQNSNSKWTAISNRGKGRGKLDISIHTASPIINQDNHVGSLNPGLVTICSLNGSDSKPKLYATKLEEDGEGHFVELAKNVSANMKPSSVRQTSNDVTTIAFRSAEILAIRSTPDNPTNPTSYDNVVLNNQPDISGARVLGNAVDFARVRNENTFCFCLRDGTGSTSVATWAPFEIDGPPLFRTEIPSVDGVANGVPSLLPKHVIVPTKSSEVIITNFGIPRKTALKTALILNEGATDLAVGEEIALPTSDGYVIEFVPSPIAYQGRSLYEFNSQIIDDDIFVISNTTTFTAAVNNLAELTLDDSDTTTLRGSSLLIDTGDSRRFYVVTTYDSATKVATLDRNLEVANPASPPANVHYQTDFSFQAEIADSNNLEFIVLDEDDLVTEIQTLLQIRTDQSSDIYEVVDYDPDTLIAELDRELDVNTANIPSKVSYLPIFTGGVEGSDKVDLSEALVANALSDEVKLLITTNSPIFITTDASSEKYFIKSFNLTTMVAALDRDLVLTDSKNPVVFVLPGRFSVQQITDFTLLPLMRVNDVPGDNSGAWNASLLDQTPLSFPGANPVLVNAKALEKDGAQPRLILIELPEYPWSTPPPETNGQITFFTDGSFGEWKTQLSDTSSNPELSWEYWNGTGWSSLNPSIDETLNLKKTGGVKFRVPDDLKPSELAGKTNHWIRARLIGGDYGKEKVTIKVGKPDNEGNTEQTIERSPEGIRPPTVLDLHISYRYGEEGILPEFVVTQDSGTYRDQTDANNTQGAIVEGFVPISFLLGRMNQADNQQQQKGSPSQDIGCCEPSTSDVIQKQTDSDESSPGVLGRERAILLGLTKSPSPGPINIQLRVNEQDNSEFAPLTVDTLVADKFVSVVTEDKTRGLGESGILKLSLTNPPTTSELFGFERCWLKLTTPEVGQWNPEVLGAFLNAVWASSTESLTRELLGSSDGRPNLTVKLARPPVLQGTLELRIREPLGQEAREELVKESPHNVLSNVEGLPGDWVLWHQVTDPEDEPATARVYSLDEATGTIQFGNGRHGKIPPIGRDSVVAFKYSRTETSVDGLQVPANSIKPKTAMNLVSPVETVESVISSDHPAGGAPPESDERVLRFGNARLRHRNRAVTAKDLEDIVLQNSPDIAQARAIQLSQSLKLVIVMAGSTPVPNLATTREVKRLLLAVAPPGLATKNALQVVGPNIRRFRVELKLRIESLDQAGVVNQVVKERLDQFFDTVSGGDSRTGWKLGDTPNDHYIAAALVDIPNVLTLIDLAINEVDTDGQSQTISPIASDSDLMILDADPVRIEFETSEALV